MTPLQAKSEDVWTPLAVWWDIFVRSGGVADLSPEMTESWRRCFVMGADVAFKIVGDIGPAADPHRLDPLNAALKEVENEYMRMVLALCETRGSA